VRSPTRISPGGAASSSRLVTLTVSPETNELRSRARPETTSPVLTPTRSARFPPKSSAIRCCIETAQWSARSASSSCAVGTPNACRYAVAHEFLDRAACSSHLARHRIVEAVEHSARSLRVLRVRGLCRAYEVGEQQGRQLAFFTYVRLAVRRERHRRDRSGLHQAGSHRSRHSESSHYSAPDAGVRMNL